MSAGTTTLGGRGDVCTSAGTASQHGVNSVGSAPETVAWASAATSAAVAGVTCQANTSLNFNPTYQAWVQIPTSADYVNTRVWLLWASSGAYSTAGANDLPTGGSGYGFRASTVAGDTNWQCVYYGASGWTAINSGVAISTTGHTFEVHAAGTAITWKIAGNQVCSAPYGLSGLTSYATYINTITQEAVAKNIRIGYIYQEQDTPQ
jgi:hypothetical protein